MTERIGIIGAGLAGTCLAWQLWWRDADFVLIDRREETTSSKIAAGLITPVTGKRFVKSWRFDDFWSAAEPFYRRVEQELRQTSDEQVLLNVPLVRLFASRDEQEIWSARAAELGALTNAMPTLVDSTQFRVQYGGIEMPSAHRLRVAPYLQSSWDFFSSRNCTVEHDVRLPEESSSMQLPLKILPIGEFTTIVDCRGVSSFSPLWRPLRFLPAKGEILTISCPDWAETRTLNRGVWITRDQPETLLAGSTYEWKQLDHQPTVAGREQITSRLREFLKLSFEVVDQRAAVRPASVDARPVVGQHPTVAGLYTVNGLGSKGGLQAPLLTEQLAELLVAQREIDPAFQGALAQGR